MLEAVVNSQQGVLGNTTTGACSTGYTCAGCGSWVTYGYGNTHICSQWPIYSWPTYSWPSSPQITKFRGQAETLADLPRPGIYNDQAKTGDAWFVKDPGVLVVRVSNGWHQFDS